VSNAPARPWGKLTGDVPSEDTERTTARPPELHKTAQNEHSGRRASESRAQTVFTYNGKKQYL